MLSACGAVTIVPSMKWPLGTLIWSGWKVLCTLALKMGFNRSANARQGGAEFAPVGSAASAANCDSPGRHSGCCGIDPGSKIVLSDAVASLEPSHENHALENPLIDVSTTADGVVLRPMTSADLDASHALSLRVHWPHRLADWQFNHEFGSGLVAERDGELVGTAQYWPWGE